MKKGIFSTAGRVIGFVEKNFPMPPGHPRFCTLGRQGVPAREIAGIAGFCTGKMKRGIFSTAPARGSQ
jgi:hypothetical protein